MELVGTRACREVEKTAADLAELRGEVAGLKRELLDHFDGGLSDGAGPAGIISAGDVLALDNDLEVVWRNSIYAGALAGTGNAGRQDDEAGPAADRTRAAATAAEVERQVVDSIAAHVDALLGILAPQHGGFCRYGHCIRRGAHLKNNIETHGLRDLHLHVRLTVA